MRHSHFWTSAGELRMARVLPCLAFVVLIGLCRPAQAQWITQTNALKSGWNSVFFHVDASHTTIDLILAEDPSSPIEEIWYWQPALPTGQFVESPQLPTGGGTQWSTWTRLAGPNSVLQRLTGNGAYLVKVASKTASYSWRVKGKPVAPTYRWTLTGLNFIGFPTPPAAPPFFEAFLAAAPELQQKGEVYRYQGGELNATNPVRVVAFRTTPVRRDQAYWVRAGDSYNQYFGPIQIIQASAAGIRFGDGQGQAQLRLRNLANVPVTITLRQIASEAPPAGQPSVAGAPPLLLRGAINNTNLTFGYTALASGPQTWQLAAAGQTGSEVEVVLGLNRSQMSGPPGAVFAGALRFTDSLGLSQVDVAVSAEKESTAGLWVGGAAASYVSHYLKPYAKAANAAEFTALLARLQLAEGAGGYHYERDPNTGRVMVFGGADHKSGSYLLDGPIKIDSGTVARPFPLRLIVHNDGSSAKLLQKVYHGVGLASNAVLTTKETLLLPGQLAEARRISSVQFPTSAGNIPWNFTGVMRQGGSLTASVPLAYDDQASNPFLHTYHPDHDNLDASFTTPLPRGLESYGVTRQITLAFTAPQDDFNSLTQGGQDLTGNYTEVMTFEARGSQTRQYNVLGTFTLKRISDIATLTSN
ncbi:MAG: hypothetical protein HYR88_17385 [Verrucomicrobia bacterium]|nr:hypothetical protein [Verrucomicrobiota bacterium]MBI3869865.1 hypothetical protein [Verrucomicrobiota bacterium]